MLPGDVTDPVERAVITNNSDVPLDLYMYLSGAGGAACSATKLGWESLHPFGVHVAGYTSPAVPTDPGDVAASGSENFTLIYSAGNTHTNLWGAANRVLVAPASEFGNGDEVAMRQVVGLANDAANNLQGQSCVWTLNFVGETQ